MHTHIRIDIYVNIKINEEKKQLKVKQIRPERGTKKQ